MIAVESFLALFFLRRAAPWADLLRVAAVAFALYSHWFYWHFQLGQKSGEGNVCVCVCVCGGGGGRDRRHAPITSRVIVLLSSPRARAADGDAFMPAEFQKTIPGNSQYDPEAPKQPFWPSFFFVRGCLRASALNSSWMTGSGHAYSSSSLRTRPEIVHAAERGDAARQLAHRPAPPVGQRLVRVRVHFVAAARGACTSDASPHRSFRLNCPFPPILCARLAGGSGF